MKPRFIRIAEVLERTGLGRSTIYKYMAAGTFPPRVSVGGRSVSWLESEIDGWMLAKIEGRDLAWQTRQMSMSTAISPASRAAAHGSH
ncbi:helix-turn-helix transcriptional regulator [Halopseudomonas pelagia]|uniref:AlpA family phage regulatory protein n=1 Tax=Halopseudomonas pelagia TaxID=553151 RepID=A0AA91Z946_9GAMM|nr:AlpA family transcriptional regulator [Halopseudomonas pelagia]PCD01461.1 AlpA family transcriptional regulator [Halopseudomonas pelagia]QFY58807.1 AlpA family phage regulatory protein [Halopseudomonas pelagia]